jgi:hypothetical protein
LNLLHFRFDRFFVGNGSIRSLIDLTI